MSKKLFWILCISIIVTGCIDKTVKQGVKGHTFYSTNPSLALKLDPDFQLLNEDKRSGWTNQDDLPSGTITDRKTYYFMHNREYCSLIISLDKTDGINWHSVNELNIPNKIISGTEEYFGKDYFFYISLIENGNKYGLVKEYIGIQGGSSDTTVHVVYTKSLEEKNINSKEWIKNARLNPDEHLSEFMADFDKKIKFIDIVSVNLD